MQLITSEIGNLDKTFRINLINSIHGIKPGNLIGTKSKDGNENLAVFNSVFHVGANPPLIGFVMRPVEGYKRDTYENIKSVGYYTINAIPTKLVREAHNTSAKFEEGESEFEKCGIEAEYIDDFPAPFVKVSPIKIGLKYEDELFIKKNETRIIIGLVEKLIIPDNFVDEKGFIDLEGAQVAGIAGLNTYYSVKEIARFPYARAEDMKK